TAKIGKSEEYLAMEATVHVRVTLLMGVAAGHVVLNQSGSSGRFVSFGHLGGAMDLTEQQRDRAAGVLLGQAIGDALGVPYEFGTAPLDGAARMLGGGLGDYLP